MRVTLLANPLTPSSLPPFVPNPSARSQPVWVCPQQPGAAPEVAAYRLRFNLDAEATIRIHVSADERYDLWLDGARVGRGPERGVRSAWFYESYDLALAAGAHVLVGRVWRLGPLAPEAQVSTAPGFLLVAEEPWGTLLSTGAAPWEVKLLGGWTFSLPAMTGPAPWFAGANEEIDGAHSACGAESGEGAGWEPVAARREDGRAFVGHLPAHVLTPAPLPPQISVSCAPGTVRCAAVWPQRWDNPQAVSVAPADDDPALLHAWQEFAAGAGSVHVPPHTCLQVIFDLDQYLCAYPQLVTTGGAGSAITLCWAEALYLDPQGTAKGHRDVTAGCFFVAPRRDVFRPAGEPHRGWETLWWRAGRYLQLLIETAAAPLIVEHLHLEETRYPLAMESACATADGRLDRLAPLALRTLQMCAHETYMDCPYYEQLMFAGDTRLEALTTYAISRDDRLPRKALTLFDHARTPSGQVCAHTPSRSEPVFPPFSLWYVAMVHDYAAWRGDRAFVASLLPGVRAVLDAFLGCRNDAGLLAAPQGWNFVDWVPAWLLGVPPDGSTGVSGLLNWHLVYTLRLAAQLEEWAGEPELAQRCARHCRQLAAQVSAAFWNEERSLFADDLAHIHFSEHTQALALLSGLVADDRCPRIAEGLLNAPDLTRTTIYFSHYLFEAYRLLGCADALFARMGLWFGLTAQGFKTLPERPEPTRSDCHGWAAHPLYHTFATVLGIRPAGFGFRRVEIAPLLGPLTSASGVLVHPRGEVSVDFQVSGSALTGEIILPPGLTGILRCAGRTQELAAGKQPIVL